MTRIAIAHLPSGGVWRVQHKTTNPQSSQRIGISTNSCGNRFDSISGSFGTLYFGATLEVCFAETLARLRPKAILKVIAGDEWRTNNWMESGSIPADWRHQRIAINATMENELPFVDIDHPETLAELNTHRDLMVRLSHCGVNELDLGIVTGKDRLPTRCIAEHLFSMKDALDHPQWNGIRYVSRHGEGRECWAIFDRAPLTEVQWIPIERSHPALVKVDTLYGLTVY